MGMFKRKPRNETVRESDRDTGINHFDSDDDDEYDTPNSREEVEIELPEPVWPEGVGSPPPKRCFGKGPDAAVTAQPAVIPPVRPADKKRTPQEMPAAQRDTVRMTAEIPRELHTRLRIHAIRSNMKILQVIEEWIQTHTAE